MKSWDLNAVPLSPHAPEIMLLLTPWPGNGHPGAMDLDDKKTVRQRAAEHRAA